MRIVSQAEKRELNRPPDYQSRSLQWRMLLVLGMLFAVIFAYDQTRRPEMWKWMFELDGPAEKDSSVPDARLTPAPPPTPRSSDEIVLPVQPVANPPAELDAADPAKTLQDSWLAAWKAIDTNIAIRDRRLLFELLRQVQQTDQAQWKKDVTEVLTRLDEAWSNYLIGSRAALVDLSPAEQIAWKHVLDQLGERWSGKVLPLLTAQAEGTGTSGHQETAELLRLLDQIGLENVQDDTPWRGAERETWFQLLRRLQQTTPADLAKASPGYVSYSQLFKQSKSYRGKLVTMRGEAVAVYPEPAAKNSYGIEQYWVYWLYPHGGPASPLLVYALEKPAGFPSFNASDMGHRQLATREDVEFTGYFFKRYAYQGQGGIYTAPAIVAVAPNWLRSEELPRPPVPPVGIAFMAVAALAALAALFAAWVYVQYRPGGSRDMPSHVTIKPPSEDFI